jgi:hypothetical protein
MWVKALNVKSDTPNLIEEKVNNCLEHIGRVDKFLNRIPITLTDRATNTKKNLMVLKSFCKAKYSINKIKQ